MTDQDFSDPEYVLGAVLAQVEDLTPSEKAQVLTQALDSIPGYDEHTIVLKVYVNMSKEHARAMADNVMEAAVNAVPDTSFLGAFGHVEKAPWIERRD